MNITEIIQDAKEHLLEHGDHIPTLFVEFEGKELAMLVFADFPDAGYERQKQFFLLGRETASEYRDIRVNSLYFISEAWGVSLKPGEKSGPHKSLADDPRRTELLTVQLLDASTPPKLVQQMYSAEMLRTGESFLDLAPVEGPMDCTNKLLMAFLAGTLSATLSERELAQMLRKY